MTTKFPKVNEINTAGILVKNRILHYNGGPLRCQTGLVECPGGVSEDGKIRINLSDSSLVKIREIDGILSNIAEQEEMDHQPISLNLTIGQFTRFFDSNKEPIDRNSSILASEFTALVLLDMSRLIVFNDRLMLSVTVQQVMVRAYNQLPRGCFIYSSLSELRESGALDNRNGSDEADTHTEEACVSDESAGDINELL
jgi:hypothetical protein